jgi:hypothetical protein
VKVAAALGCLALAATACGGATGVRDEGKTPTGQAPLRSIVLWFVRPGGRVGVVRDLAPVSREIRADPGKVARLVLRALARGPSPDERLAGYRTVLDDGLWRANIRGSTVRVTQGYVSGVNTAVNQGGPVPWIALAGAAQIQKTLSALPGVRTVRVWGLSRAAIQAQLLSGRDPGLTNPVPRASCALAQALPGQLEVGISHVSQSAAIVHVRAKTPVAIEFTYSRGPEGSGNPAAILEATATPCGSADVRFPQPRGVRGALELGAAFQVRVTPLSGPVVQGVTRTFRLRR